MAANVAAAAFSTVTAQHLLNVASISVASGINRKNTVPATRRTRALKVAAYTMASHAAEWKVPPSQDGWVLSHDALRLDLHDLQRLLDALAAQAAAGKPLELWQLEAAKAAWDHHAHMLAVHHDTEEELYFPLLRTRFAVPAKQSEDHQRIVGLLQECTTKFKAAAEAPNSASAAQLLPGLQASFAEFRGLCQEHYREEEVETLPLIREHFAPEEINPTAKKIAKAYGLLDMGNYLRPMSREQQVAWMTRVRMPFFIQWLMLLQGWRYNRQVVQPLERAIQHAQS